MFCSYSRITHYYPQPVSALLHTRIATSYLSVTDLLDAAPSPSKEAEKGGGGKSSPCKPDKGGISLSLSAAVDAVDVGVDIMLAINPAVDDIVVCKVSTHGVSLIAAALDGYPGSESL